MSASYKQDPGPEHDELEALFKTFDKQLHEVQKKFSDLEKDIAGFRTQETAGDTGQSVPEDAEHPEGKDQNSGKQ